MRPLARLTKGPAIWRGLLCAVALTTSLSAAGAASAEPRSSGFDPDAAMADIRHQLTFGSRGIGAPGHAKEAAMIRAEFARLGATVEEQSWTEQLPAGERTLTNIIARFNPASPKRIVLGTHYDSINRAYADPVSPQAVMPGANNSASGVALLVEAARALHRHPVNYGVDFIFFDGEEGPLSLGAGDPNWRALGSPHFIKTLGETYPAGKPKLAIIFDMVCYRNLKLKAEDQSLIGAPEESDEFWRIGRGHAPSIFTNQPYGAAISDDHNAFLSVGVPAFLVIGFDYAPYFNTTQDTPDKCSTASIGAVGDTVLDYLHSR